MPIPQHCMCYTLQQTSGSNSSFTVDAVRKIKLVEETYWRYMAIGPGPSLWRGTVQTRQLVQPTDKQINKSVFKGG
jgi:hypothetical protein